MGKLFYLSWSYSRSRTYRECKRKYFYEYASNEEPFVDQAKLLKKLTFPDMVAGQAVDWTINDALKKLKETGERPSGLGDKGVNTLRNLFVNGRRNVERMKNGRSMPDEAQPLHNEYYGIPARPNVERDLEVKVVTCLDNFEDSELLARLIEIGANAWGPIHTNDEKSAPSFDLDGIPVYAKYDLYFVQDGELVILDWKSGQASDRALSEAETQLAVYALYGEYALHHLPEQIRVQAVFLKSGAPKLDPRAISPTLREIVIDLINAEYEEQRETLVDTEEIWRGAKIWQANIENYGAEPLKSKCNACKYLELCDEGKAVVDFEVPTPEIDPFD